MFQTREERDSSELAGNAGGYGFPTAFRSASSRPVSTCCASRRSHASAIVRWSHARWCSRCCPAVARRLPTGAPPAPAGTSGSCGGQAAPPLPLDQPELRRTSLPHPVHLSQGPPVQMTTITSDHDERDRPAATDRGENAGGVQTPCGARMRRAGRRRPSTSRRTWSSRVFLGSRSSGGFDVADHERPSRRRRAGRPLGRAAARPGQVAAQVMTAPAHLVTVPRVDGPVRFEKVELEVSERARRISQARRAPVSIRGCRRCSVTWRGGCRAWSSWSSNSSIARCAFTRRSRSCSSAGCRWSSAARRAGERRHAVRLAGRVSGGADARRIWCGSSPSCSGWC